MIQHVLPADIERTSMEIIQRELDTMGVVLPAEHAAVVKRVIHTTADFDYAKTLTFTQNALQAGVEALQEGIPIVTDTNMARAGISKQGLAKLNSTAHCFMAEEEIARAARQHGTTRAVAAMEKAAKEFPGAILAIGNAPTALLQIVQQIQTGLRPALVIGVPVGFVNVEESKRLLLRTCARFSVPCIVAIGRKGGSNVAAAICNALIYTATDTLDPVRRK
jgi:precorrin-8X/cobalt-precorrin-8 methylmutase